jgi:hypothetical protein
MITLPNQPATAPIARTIKISILILPIIIR